MPKLQNTIRLLKWWTRQVPVVWSLEAMPRRGRLHLVSLDVPGGLGQDWRLWQRLAPPEIRTRLGDGTIYFSGQTINGDRGTFGEIFVAECYRARYRDAVVIDIGAHKGYFGAYALMHGAKTVQSYEPERSNFDYLERAAHSFRSRGHDWQTRRAAVGSRDGEAELHVGADSWSHSLVDAAPSERRKEMQIVPVVAFDTIVGSLASGDDRVIVKIDAEGAECDIALGSTLEAWAGVSEVFIELHSFALCSAEQILERIPLPLGHTNGVLHFARPLRSEA